MGPEYSLDKSNSLLIKPKGSKGILKPRGKFKIDEDNRLIFLLNEPPHWRRLYRLPSRIFFRGNWKLNGNHDLVFEVDDPRYKRSRLIFKGEIVSTGKDRLAFEIIGNDNRGVYCGQIIELSGAWQADGANRIVFQVNKRKTPDIIVFRCAWQVNKNQQIVYNYEKKRLSRGRKVSRVLAFEGFWQINEKNRLRYILENSSRSIFDFRVQLESPNLYPRKGAIKYRLGIGAKAGTPSRPCLITLYGSWKFSRKGGLDFSMDYGKGRLRAAAFGAEVSLNDKEEIVFSLTDKEDRVLGLNIAYNRKFLKKNDAEGYLRVKDILDKNRAALEAGVRVPF